MSYSGLTILDYKITKKELILSDNKKMTFFIKDSGKNIS